MAIINNTILHIQYWVRTGNQEGISPLYKNVVFRFILCSRAAMHPSTFPNDLAINYASRIVGNDYLFRTGDKGNRTARSPKQG